MNTESKLIIEKLMLAFLALKALLHKSEIVFEESTNLNKKQSYEKPENLQTEQNIGHKPVNTSTSSKTRNKPPTPLDDKIPLVSQKALSSNTVMSAERKALCLCFAL